MRQLFATANPLVDFEPRTNIAPSQMAPVVRYNPKDGQRHLDLLRWGLVPHWSKTMEIKASLINARVETLLEKPAFRDAFIHRRCLVPANAFYEWQSGTKPKQPFAITLKDGGLFAFAGLWENWRAPAGQWVRSFTILTTQANDLLVGLHQRMPVILAPVHHALWLGQTPVDPKDLQALLVPYPSEAMTFYPVGLGLNSPKNDHGNHLMPLI